MSDSDDTDILLLIPPNYFLMTIEEKLQREKEEEQHLRQRPPEQQQLRNIETDIDSLLNVTIFGSSFCLSGQPSLIIDPKAVPLRGQKDAIAMESITPPPTAAYRFLSPEKKYELNDINCRLHDIETVNDAQPAFNAPSDLSSISTCTVRTQFPYNHPRRSLRLSHSTPKTTSGRERSGNGGYGGQAEDGVLQEIDQFFGECHQDGGGDQYKSYQRDDDPRASLPYHETHAREASSLQRHQNDLVQEHQSPFKQTIAADGNLISLSEIWGKSGQITAVPNSTQVTIKEEQLRRQHLERTVRSLQSRLLEYQQRLSVAIEVDRTKDAVLASTQQECKGLNAEVNQLRDTMQKFETQQQGYNDRVDLLQKELAQAVSLASKFQEKNEKLENELSLQSRRSNECNHMYKEQLEEMEVKLHGHKCAEEFSNNELSKLKDKLAKLEYQNEKLKTRSEEVEKERDTLRHQKEMLHEFHQKQKARADNLESQRKSLQESLGSLTENEMALKKKLELQQKTLKSQYQQQLETVVAQKLKEFQTQLDKTEEALKAESRERERCMADRAVKQLERINEKNDLEMNLLQEKHNEEVELYRIQLANASKKIDYLEEKLSCYKTKRADIAEKLHDVMETQWQKALEILTSPNQTKETIVVDTDAGSPDNNETRSKSVRPNNETPKKGKTRNGTRENDLNAEREVYAPMDRLQAYIELLLSKSPSDIDRLEEILAMSKASRTSVNKFEKSHRRVNNIKPPWKA